jgi:hypothetical protein
MKGGFGKLEKLPAEILDRLYNTVCWLHGRSLGYRNRKKKIAVIRIFTPWVERKKKRGQEI